ncbi:hypothetical protein C7I85_27905 [Mesorhizobium soli]|uniref:Secreted protein n=1 Tax=Pseudaminobacter soli (ex Li et al. 2025) TaxID=1295366 RepID=A0A2P7RUE1_9HYPH|nr:hypothetical protein C7I85_27905 [Mesorhizobium soli]
MMMMVMMGVLMMPGLPGVAAAGGTASARRTADISAACGATATAAHVVGRAACGTATDPGSQRRGHQSYRQRKRSHNSHDHLGVPSSL